MGKIGIATNFRGNEDVCDLVKDFSKKQNRWTRTKIIILLIFNHFGTNFGSNVMESFTILAPIYIDYKPHLLDWFKIGAFYQILSISSE